MSLKDIDQLIDEIDAAVHTNGPLGKTTAAGLNALLRSLAAELIAQQQQTALDSSHKADLDATGKVPISQLPAVAAAAIGRYNSGDAYVAGEVVRYDHGSGLRLFEALQSGPLPPPIGSNGSINASWQEISPAGQSYQLTRTLERQAMLDLLSGDSGEVGPGLMYYIQNGAGPGRDVLARGLGEGQLEPNAYARDTPTPLNPSPTFQAVRFNAVIASAEPLDYEEVTQANLLTRFAGSLPLRNKVYRITRPGGGIVEARFDSVLPGAPVAGSIVSETAIVPGTPGTGRYDLVADTLTNPLAELQAQFTALAQKADKIQTVTGPISSTNKIRFVRDTIFDPQTSTWLSSDFDLTNAVPGTTVIAEYNGPTAPGLPAGSRVLFGTFLANTINLYHYTYLSANRVLVTITH